MNYNKAILVGRICKPIVKRITAENTPYATFSIAVNRTFGEGTDFFNCVAWGQRSEFIANNLKVGNLVLIEGRHQTQQRLVNGETRYYYEVVVDLCQALESKLQRGQAQQGNYQQNQNQYQSQNNLQQNNSYSQNDMKSDFLAQDTSLDEDIPF